MNFKPGLLPRPATARRFQKLSLAGPGCVVPAHLDRRSELLPCSDQGSQPRCAAYAMAGWLEYYRWKFYGVAEQINPHPIYERAKTLDGMPNLDGTTLEAALAAAGDLGLISPVDTSSIREVSSPADVQQAIHRYGVVLAAFEVTDAWSRAEAGGWIPPGGKFIGGHAVVLCGYSQVEAPPWYAIQNSWGEAQGWRGFNRLTPHQFESQFQYGLVWDFQR